MIRDLHEGFIAFGKDASGRDAGVRVRHDDRSACRTDRAEDTGVAAALILGLPGPRSLLGPQADVGVSTAGGGLAPTPPPPKSLSSLSF